MADWRPPLSGNCYARELAEAEQVVLCEERPDGTEDCKSVPNQGMAEKEQITLCEELPDGTEDCKTVPDQGK